MNDYDKIERAEREITRILKELEDETSLFVENISLALTNNRTLYNKDITQKKVIIGIKNKCSYFWTI